MKGRKLSAKEKREKAEQDASYRRQLFKELCEHVGRGLSKESYAGLHSRTVETYFKVYPEEFDREEYEIALQKGRDTWENIGYRQANGQCLGNSRSWYYNMANRYGWREKVEIEAEHKGQVSVNVVSYATQKALDSVENKE